LDEFLLYNNFPAGFTATNFIVTNNYRNDVTKKYYFDLQITGSVAPQSGGIYIGQITGIEYKIDATYLP
jgi:hypothetical protein